MSTCTVCHRKTTAGESIQHDCGHRSHGWCLDEDNLDFTKCAACRGETSLPSVEPSSLSGRDYISKPAERGRMDRVRRLASNLRRGGPEDATDAFYLVSLGPAQCPVSFLIRKKSLGLQRLLEEGVRMDDFLRAGYDWNELREFHDLDATKVGPERVRDALFALETNAEQLRDDLPWETLQKEAKITPEHVCSLFGLHFPLEGGACAVKGGENKYAWDAADLVRMKFVEADLKAAGLRYYEQYDHLEPNDAEERALGMTEEFVTGLPSLQENVDVRPVTRHRQDNTFEWKERTQREEPQPRRQRYRPPPREEEEAGEPEEVQVEEDLPAQAGGARISGLYKQRRLHCLRKKR